MVTGVNSGCQRPLRTCFQLPKSVRMRLTEDRVWPGSCSTNCRIEKGLRASWPTPVCYGHNVQGHVLLTPPCAYKRGAEGTVERDSARSQREYFNIHPQNRGLGYYARAARTSLKIPCVRVFLFSSRDPSLVGPPRPVGP